MVRAPIVTSSEPVGLTRGPRREMVGWRTLTIQPTPAAGEQASGFTNYARHPELVRYLPQLDVSEIEPRRAALEREFWERSVLRDARG